MLGKVVYVDASLYVRGEDGKMVFGAVPTGIKVGDKVEYTLSSNCYFNDQIETVSVVKVESK